jgi:hypothetical protein
MAVSPILRMIAQARYGRFLPAMLDWIVHTLDSYAEVARPVASFGFQRLPLYFSESLLNAAQVVVTDRLPVPPLSAMGLSEFVRFEVQAMTGVTYLDTYFLVPNASADEAVHLHELVHVIQWQVLGARDFLLFYAAGMVEHGYSSNPLEQMAYEHQAKFDGGEPAYSVGPEVREQVLAMTGRPK